MFSLRDEFASVEPEELTQALGRQALTFEKFAARVLDAGRCAPPLRA